MCEKMEKGRVENKDKRGTEGEIGKDIKTRSNTCMQDRKQAKKTIV